MYLTHFLPLVAWRDVGGMIRTIRWQTKEMKCWVLSLFATKCDYTESGNPWYNEWKGDKSSRLRASIH